MMIWRKRVDEIIGLVKEVSVEINEEKKESYSETPFINPEEAK